ncbi:MAG: TOBE domain-containing protein [Methanosarcinales archaeon]|nr:TOBE domain-containing protein [Methanosarcinales archaeon]
MFKIPISARNKIEGVVTKIENGTVASTVKIEISKSANLTSMITKEAVEELNLKEGDKVEAVIKATEILILKE